MIILFQFILTNKLKVTKAWIGDIKNTYFGLSMLLVSL